MGGSTRWVKSLVGLGRKSDGNQHEKSTCAGKSGRWRLWRTSSSDFGALWRGGSGNRRSASAVSECSSVAGEMFGTVMAAVARARPREFRLLRQEWAAIRIQTAFRGLLARKALRSLKAVVRIQAIVRGWLVRKQAAVTLKCMQSLVRVQARVRAHRACLSTEEQQSKKNTRPSHPLLFSSSGPLQELVQNELRIHKKAENGWCNQKGTLDDIRAKLNMQKDAAIKRERQLAYSNSQQLKRSNSKRNSSPLSTRGDKDNNSTNQFCWIEKCRASKGWVDRPHGPYSDASECQSSKQHEKLPWKPREFALEMGAAKINNANSRISNTHLTIHNIKGRYWQNHSTSSSLESHCGKSVSSSSISTSKSNSSVFGHERGEVSSKPTMELPTKPVKANSSSCSSSHQSTIKKVFGESLHRNCSKSSTLKSKLGIYSSHSNSSISSCSKSSHPKGL